MDSEPTDAFEVDHRVRPAYDASIVNVPDTAAAILDAPAERPLENTVASLPNSIEHVVLFVIDALGWQSVQRLRGEIEALDRLVTDASTTSITSTYPSETAAAMTSMYTGLQPIEHGLIGWFTRFEQPTCIGHSLPFVDLEGRPLDASAKVDPDRLLDRSHRTPITERLVDAGISVTYHSPDHIIDSPASCLTAGAADLEGYEALDGRFEAAASAITEASGPTYQLVYEETVDTQGHHHGPQSPQFRIATAEAIDTLYDRFINRLSPAVAEQTAVLVTADHGQVPADHAASRNLGRPGDTGYPALDANLERIDDGPIYLAGSPRNLQVHLDGGIETVARAFKADIDGCVFDEDDIRQSDLFGDASPSPVFERRIPDLLVIPDRGGVWYDDGELDLAGLHGGLSPAEMLVPLFAARVSDLR